MMEHITGNGVRTIIVETANRFARDLIVQETGWRYLRDAGINLIAADSPEAFLSDTPTAVMIRQVQGAFSQFEKGMLVAKLKGARDRKKAETGKCGGRKSYAERDPAMVALGEEAGALHDQRPQAVATRRCRRARGGWSRHRRRHALRRYGGLAHDLCVTRLLTPAGGQWHAVTVKRVLSRLG